MHHVLIPDSTSGFVAAILISDKVWFLWSIEVDVERPSQRDITYHNIWFVA